MIPGGGWIFGPILLAAAVAAGAEEHKLRLDRSPALYSAGERPELSYIGADAAILEVEDWQGRSVQRLELGTGAGETVLAELPAGYYELVLKSGANEDRRAFAVLEPATGLSQSFGVATHFAQGWNTDIVPMITRAGIGTVRDEQYWKHIEPQPGTYASPKAYAHYMAELEGAGIEPLLVLSFANPHFDGGFTPFTPAGRAAFAAYGAELARRHAGQVHAFEVWNEINGSFCSGPCRLNRADTYAALLADSYAALKAVDPDLTALGGAAVKVPLPWFEALVERGAARYWDAVAVHPYGENPEDAGQDIAALQQLLRKAGSEVPIWATEFGTGAGKTGIEDRRETAAYLARIATVLRAAGVQRMYWYLLRDYDTFKGMGLLRGEKDPLGRYAPTPAYTAYATFIRLLDGASEVVREPTDPRTRVYRFRRHGETTYILWAVDGPVAATVDLPDGGVLTDLVGNPRSLPAGVNALELDRYPLYLRGEIRELDADRPDRLLADARADFNIDPKDRGSWNYGAYQTRGQPKSFTCRPPEGALLPLQRRASAWEHFYGDPRWPALRVAAGTLHPAASKGQALWAVRSYRSDAAGPLRVRGAFSRKGKGDGAGACIVLDGAPVFEAQLPPGARQRKEFDLHLQVKAGARLEFLVTPGPALDITDDAVGLQARLARPRVSP